MLGLARRQLGRACALLTVASVLACAHGRSARGPSIASGSADIIVRQEIDSLMAQYHSAYELIQKARPNMLVSRDVRLPYPTREGLVSEPTGIKVFVDALYVGGIDMLRRIPSRSVLFVQRLSPSDATTRYGSGMVAGAIVITTGTRWR